MQVSMNWVRRYVDLPEELSLDQIAYDLTMRTVEVEEVIDTGKKFENIIAAKILEVKPHPNADKLRICMVDIGEEEPVQIVCGGTNLYAGENVVVCKPGAMVVWHGEGEPVKIKETKMRGEYSYGMICAPAEVYLDGLFPTEDDAIIVDLGDMPCTPGQNIAEVVGMDDVVLDIDNKSLTNRPDLWGQYGIAREISAIYDLPLRPLEQEDLKAANLPSFPVEIEAKDKCYRYAAVEIQNVDAKTESPLWMKTSLINAGMRPINAIVDITNYVMLAVGQPTHAFDRTHVVDKIVVRNAVKGEELTLLDGNELDLTEGDLVICDAEEPMALAGIRGGRKDSILPETTSVLLEVATFTAQTIRKTGKRFDEKTDASIRYEKGIDTERVDLGISMVLSLFRQIFPSMEVTAYGDNYPVKTERAVVEVTQDFLDSRLGKVFTEEEVTALLTRLGFDVTCENGNYTCVAPTWRSTGDISIKDDILDEIARILSFDSFEAQPLTITFEHPVHQLKESVDRKLREFLAFRCGFNEVFTYPWVDEKYITASGIDPADCIRLATPPAPELASLRRSLIPGLLETTVKNLRYFDSFRVFELAEVFHRGVYHESSEDETLPLQPHYLTGGIVGDDGKAQFFEVKGIIESIPRFCHLAPLSFGQAEKPSWADDEAWLNILSGKEVIGAIALVSVQAMSAAGIRRKQIAAFEFNMDKLEPLASRSNTFEHLPQFPLVEEDLSLLVDENVTWKDIHDAICHHVKELHFVEEYRGKQIPAGKKSVMLNLKIGSDKGTLKAKQIEKQMAKIVKTLENKCGAILREE